MLGAIPSPLFILFLNILYLTYLPYMLLNMSAFSSYLNAPTTIGQRHALMTLIQLYRFH
ncbi:hypothetical protein SAMN05216167_1338 [Spirosoma endophyticum]|uniref:Uncharacterized protein n=1 Tax=Spirosoma endophyticum TaxID=662367 RepID=A0A1I2GKR0_9BACT|nr:hypothetical protein SAMN05216167_1338 [Spirosoma endophyticum]